MTTKNWLIRTKNNHILGPVSKSKIIELVENGSVKCDDELCSGNGHWFFVHESDYVNRYIYNNEILSFNPISEAKTVMATKDIHLSLEAGPPSLPSLEDLDYPELKDNENLVLNEENIVVPKTEVKKMNNNDLPGRSTLPQNFLNDKIILILAITFLFLALYAFSQRKKILEALANVHWIVAPALADPNIEIQDFEKKK